MPSLSYRVPRRKRGALAAGNPPGNTVAPVISGTPTEGETLSTTNGTWTNSPLSFAYTWRRNGTAIGGATGATYALTGADVGAMITCRVIATNADGSGAAISNALGPVAEIPDLPAPTQPVLLKEDGFRLLKEDGFRLVIEVYGGPYLLKEDGFRLLKEDGYGLLLDDTSAIPPTAILDVDGLPILDMNGDFILEP